MTGRSGSTGALPAELGAVSSAFLCRVGRSGSSPAAGAMLAVQDGLVVVGIGFVVELWHGGSLGFRLGERFPVAVADPRTLFLAGVLDVEDAGGFSVFLELVFDFA